MMDCIERRKMESILFVYCIAIFLGRTNPQLYPFTFEIKTVSQVVLRPVQRNPVSFSHPEERQKLCMYATMVAGLAYIEYGYTPSWNVYVPSSSSELFDYGMYCPTLPTVYVLQKAWSSTPPLQITFVSSKITFEFDEQHILADFVVLREGTKTVDESFNFFAMDVEDRRNVCVAAREYVLFQFTGLDVPEAQPYEFQDKPAEIYLAIPCPAIPALYVRRNSLTKKLEMVFQRAEIDYNFASDPRGIAIISELSEESYSLSDFIGHPLTFLNEAERMTFCAVARKAFGAYYVPFVRLDYVPEAQMYTFQYTDEQEKLDKVAILCPTSHMYLHTFVEYGVTRIKMTFAQTEASQYNYQVEIVSNLVGPLSQTKADEHWKKLERRRNENRETGAQLPNEVMTVKEFARLRDEDCWDLCLAAQRYLRSEPNYTFVFTTQYSTLFYTKLLLMPENISGPEFYKIISRNSDENGIDIFIRCSHWPRMYLSLGFNGITITLLERELSKTKVDIPPHVQASSYGDFK